MGHCKGRDNRKLRIRRHRREQDRIFHKKIGWIIDAIESYCDSVAKGVTIFGDALQNAANAAQRFYGSVEKAAKAGNPAKCALCGDPIFVRPGEEQAATQDFRERFPGFRIEESVVLCSECSQQVLGAK